MSKFRNGLMNRVMAVILSGAMVMSSVTLSDITAYAAETENDSNEEYSETFSESEKGEAEETDNKTVEEAENEETKETSTFDDGGDGDSETGLETGSGIENETPLETVEQQEGTSESTSENEPEPTVAETTPETQPESNDIQLESSEAQSESDEIPSESSEAQDDNNAGDELPDVYSEGTVDLKNGLTAGTNYGDDVLTFTVLEDMTYNPKKTTIIEEVEYVGYVAGTKNPELSGNIPTGGAAFKITAKKNSFITFLAGKSADKDRTWYFASEGKTTQGPVDKEKDAPYKFEMEAGNVYYFYVKASKPYIYGISWEEKMPRPTWDAEILKPTIETVALDDTDPSKINVTVNTIIGEQGADKVAVYMYDEEGNEVKSAESTEVGEKPVLTLSPSATGKYKFKAVISRIEEETPIEGDMTAEFFDFTLVLAIPQNVTAKNRGNGSVQIEWDPVEGAEKYIVEVIDHEELKTEAPLASKIIKGLETGATYRFTVRAVNGEEVTEPSEPVSCTVADKDDRKWTFTTYGNGISAGKDSYKENDDGSVTITANSGKIVPNSNDGLAFYYTAVNPNTTNFKFSANAHVDSWKYSNGQEGFGIMAADRVTDFETGGSRVWNNSYQAVISKIVYRWNGFEISEDNSGESIEMLLGVGATEKVGVTQDDLKELELGNIQQPKQYKAEQTAIDTTFAKYKQGRYNIVANYVNDDAPTGSKHELYEDFYLEIEKNNTGYYVSYAPYVCQKDEQGNLVKNEKGVVLYELKDGKKVIDESKRITKKYYDPEALSVLDPDNVYVGVFAARNAKITFQDINLTSVTIDEDEDRDQNRPVKYLNLSTSVLSGPVTNTPDYDFMFASNWYGTFRLIDSSGNVLSKHTVKVKDENGEEKEEEIDYYDVVGTLDPVIQAYQDGDDAKDTKVHVPLTNLSIGKNVFTVEYTPDEEWSPERDKYTNQAVVKLKTYDTVKISFTVEYRKYGQEGQTLHVSQDGTSTNLGTKESPLDIYTAVKYVQPGQTILLAGGRYSLNRTLQITRGVSGEADLDENGKETYNKYIKMMGDPDADERPVLDFNNTVAAVVAVGNYWYFKDFDVIRCKDGEKGIQLSGSYCVLDRVDTYRNGSTGLQICRAAATDTYSDWPHDNLVLNCNSYLNVDKGYEDADGFAAKLTSGSNNVFDGCIAAFNADDGWDLFAKAQTGNIGGVVIKNSLAYRNGYVLKAPDGSIDVNGVCVKGDGNGNGFKMGGDGIRGGSEKDPNYGKDPDATVIPNVGHKLINSLAFGNKSKGFDSNSCPNIKIYNSISFDNDASNISLKTYDTNKQTDYVLKNVISMRTPIEPSILEEDSQTFTDKDGKVFNFTHSIKFRDEMDAASKSAAVYFSLKNEKSNKATAKVWWSSSDPDCELMIHSESGEELGREAAKNEEGEVILPITYPKRYENNGIICSELDTSGKEKCYLGAIGGSIKLYRVEITAPALKGEEDPANADYKERTYTIDVGEMVKENKADYNKNGSYFKLGELTKSGYVKVHSNKKVYPDLVETQIRYRGTPSDATEQNEGTDYKAENIFNETVYLWNPEKDYAVNSKDKNKTLSITDFESTTYPYLDRLPDTKNGESWRNSDGTINVGNFLKLKPNAGSYPSESTPSLGGSPSNENIKPGEDTDGSVSTGNSGVVDDTIGDYGEDYPGNLNVNDEDGNPKYFGRIWAADIKYVDYTDKEDIVYTGKAIVPEVHVRFSGNVALLRKGKDYRLKYTNNVNAGTATVTITGAGNYAGYNNTKTFEIKPINLTDVSVSIPSEVAIVSGGDATKEIKPTWKGKSLKKGKDYDIKSGENGNLIVTKGESGNFVGEKEVIVRTVDADKLLSKAKVKVIPPEHGLIYAGVKTPVKPKCEVTLGGSTLTEGTDYRIEYANNEEVGKATLTVIGMGTYAGSKSVNFTIKGGNLKDAVVKYKDSSSGTVQEIALTDYVQKIDGIVFNGSKCDIPVNLITVEMNGKTLKNNTDYQIVQKGTDRAGSATITIKGINGYMGVQTFKYKITPIQMEDLLAQDKLAETDKTKDKVFIYGKTRTYTVGGVKYVAGGALAEGNFNIRINGNNIDPKHYSLSYKNNNMLGTEGDVKPPTIVVTGRNGLKGKIELPFNIERAQMTGNTDIVLTVKDIATNEKALKKADLKKAKITITQTVNLRSKRLSAGRDYDKNSIEYWIDTNNNFKIDNGDTKVDVTSKEELEFDKDKGYMTVLVRAYAAASNPKCYFKEGGYVDGYFRVGTYDLNKAKITNLADRVFGKEYNASNGETSAISWDAVVAQLDKYVTVTYKNPSTKVEEPLTWNQLNDYATKPEILDNGDGFVIVPNSYKKNERVGTASFEIRGTGKYSGTKRVTFKIVSKQTADKKAAK